MTKRISEGVDNYEFALIKNLKGYYSSIEPSIAPANVLVRGSQNVYKTALGILANRHGRKQYDAVDTTIAGVKASYVWKTSLGSNRILSIANSKLEIVSDIVTANTFVHYTLLSSLATTRGVFDAWWNNTLKKDELLFVIGDTTLYMWHGGIGKIASTTSNTIVLNASVVSLGFNTANGSVLINGTTYTYTGSSASTLTGVTADPTGEAANSVVLSTIVQTATTPSSDSNTFTNDFIRVINNRLHVGSYISRLVYISSNSDYTNFTVPGTRTAGTPELITLDNPCQGIGVRGNELAGNAHIFGGNADMYVVTYQQITVGTTLQEQTNVDKKNFGIGGGAYSHEFIDSLGDTLIWLSKDQQLKTYGVYSVTDHPQSPILSNEISTDLANEDFTLGQLTIIGGGDKGDVIYLTAPNAGVTYIYQIRTTINEDGEVVTERFWNAPFIWGLSRIDSIGTTVVGFSNSNPQIYTLWDTGQWHDDSPSGEALAYNSVALFSYQSHGRRQGKVNFDKIYWEGFMTQGTSLYGGIYYDYQGATAILSPIIHSIKDESSAPDASFLTGVTPPSLGDASLGDNPLGGITEIIGLGTTVLRDRDLLPKFRIITGVPITNCFEYALMIYSTSADDRWELLALGTNATEAPFSAVEITK